MIKSGRAKYRAIQLFGSRVAIVAGMYGKNSAVAKGGKMGIRNEEVLSNNDKKRGNGGC